MTEFCMEHAAHAQLLKRYDDRLNAHGEAIDTMNVCITKLTVIQEELAEWKRETDARLDTIEKAPVTKWNTVVTTVITSLVSALIGSMVTAFSIINA